MAYFSLHSYDADVWISEFKGLSQSDTGLNPNPVYAAIAENVETPNGVLQPQAACPQSIGSFEQPVETLASFYRRWYEGPGSKEFYVCASGGKLYYRQAGSVSEWVEIDMPFGVDAFQLNEWSWVTYEINPENSDDTVDVLLMSNGQDGMIMVVPPDRPSTWGDWSLQTWGYMLDMTWMQAMSPDWHIIPVDTLGKKFGVIERYAERIWAAAITDNPDMLMYSRPYDPTDWTGPGVDEEPEDCAGDVLQPTWDGDRFFALRRFGDQLLAFKKNRIFRVLNTDPGSYVFREQFGGGTAFYKTIAVTGERVYMETDQGLAIFDGMNTVPFWREYVAEIWKTVNQDAMGQMCAALYRNRYYVALPVNGSTVNNAMLVYNLTERTVLYYTDFYVEAFLPTDNELFFTSSTQPGKVSVLRYNSWDEGKASGAPTRWVSPWMDFGVKSIQKGGFELYMIPEVKDEAVELKISIQTEKKLKTKTYTIQPLTGEQLAANKEHRGKRLHFGGTGRKFRIIIETEAGVTVPWRLIGGLQLIVETDPD